MDDKNELKKGHREQMTLLELLEGKIREPDRTVASLIDLSKTDEEIVATMVDVGMLDFGQCDGDDQDDTQG